MAINLIHWHRFVGKNFLQIKEADQPELINWENLKAKPLQRMLRILLTTIIFSMIVLLTAIMIVKSK